MKINENKYKKNVTKFIKTKKNHFNKLVKFVNKNKIPDSEFNRLCDIIDNQVKFNVELVMYALKNEVDIETLIEDVMNNKGEED